MTSFDWATIVPYATLFSGLIIQALKIKELTLRIRAHEMTDRNNRHVVIRPTDGEVKLYGKQPDRKILISSGENEKRTTDLASTVRLTTASEMKPAKEHLRRRRFCTLSHAFASAVTISLVCFGWVEFRRAANAEQQIINLQKAEAERKRKEDESRSKAFFAIRDQSLASPLFPIKLATQKQTAKDILNDFKIKSLLDVDTSNSFRELKVSKKKENTPRLDLTKIRDLKLPEAGN